MFRLGVIPAAGSGSRWGGYHKELLPLGEGEFMIGHTINAMKIGGADAVLIVSRPDKIGLMAAHLNRDLRHNARNHGLPVYYAIQRGGNDIWSAIVESFAIPADRYLFAMPDTLYPPDSFTRLPDTPFSLGVFPTKQPERFGVLRGDEVVNKQPGPEGLAWGLLSWTMKAVNYWQVARVADYTDGINQAIEAFGLSTFPIAFYYDMATFADYRGWLRRP